MQETANIQGTEAGRITEGLPGSRSEDYHETRSMLKNLAMAEPGDTLKRRAYYNLLEMTENWEKHPEQRPQLTRNIEREMLRLEGLS